jgi:hypothetical protein
MPKTAGAHGPQCVYRATLGCQRNWISRHCFCETCHIPADSVGQETHRISARENANQALLTVNDKNGSGATIPHRTARQANHLIGTMHQRLLIFDDENQLSVCHSSVKCPTLGAAP